MIDNKSERVQQLAQAAEQRVTGWWERANRFSSGYLGHLLQAIRSFSTSGINDAALFAYWALFSLFPLVVLSIIIATMVFDVRNFKPQIVSVLGQFIPSSVSTLIRDDIDQIVINRRSVTLISALSLLLGATRLFNALQRSLSRIFGDPRPRRWHRQMLMGLVMIAVLVILLMASSELSALLKAINLQLVNRRSPFAGVGPNLASVITTATLFTLLFRFIPRRRIAFPILVLFAVAGAVVFELSHTLFDWYLLHIANLGVVYGSLSAVIGLLTWMFFFGCIILMCAELARATDDWRLSRRVVEPVADADGIEPMISEG